MSTIEKVEWNRVYAGECEDCGYPVEAETRPDAREMLEKHRESAHNQGGNNE